LQDQRYVDSEALEVEEAQIRREVDSLLNSVYTVGDGDLAVGVVKAFEQGLIDVPFAPSKYNYGKMLPARDNDGHIRILELET
jgi:methylaspartate mutase epsilon subunit